jgi:hypothetical protein
MQEFIIKQEKPVEKLYTKRGLEEFLDEEDYPRLIEFSDNVFAKAIQDKPSKNFVGKNHKQFSYYIKTDPNKKIYNPIDRYSIEPKVAKSFINSVCKSQLMFTEVSPSIFTKYINFLKTENIKLLQEIQREIK